MKNLEKSTIASGKWLELQNITYADNKCNVRKWESIARRNCSGAVLMIITLEPSGCLVMIKQYRPPAAGVVLEFPAGLLETGEAPSVAAVREVKEETGFDAHVVRISHPAYNSPGLTGENIRIVEMTAQDTPAGARETHFDDSEDIETVLVPKKELPAYIEEFIARGGLVDAKVLAYSMNIH